MKQVSILAMVLTSAMALTACGGGDSDSSGGVETNPVNSTNTPVTTNPTTTTTTPTTTTTTPTQTAGTCAISGTNVYATTTGCTYANPSLNNGAAVTYTCVGDRVNSNIGISAKTINLNGAVISCKP